MELGAPHEYACNKYRSRACMNLPRTGPASRIRPIMVRPVRSVFCALFTVLLGSLVTSPATAAPDLTCTIESSVTDLGQVTLTMTVTNAGDVVAENKVVAC